MKTEYFPTKIMPERSTTVARPVRLARRALARARRSRDGGMGTMIAMMLPAMIGVGALAVDASNVTYRNLLLRQAVQAAALAAGNKLPTYYSGTGGSTSSITSMAQTFITANLPVAQYGTITPTTTVGNLVSSTLTFTSLASSGGTAPDAVQVSGTMSVPLYFGALFGKPTVNITSTATTSYATQKPYYTIVVNDLSQSFQSEISNQKAVDRAIANCVNGAAGSGSQVGVTAITGHATILQSLAQVNSVISSLLTFINGLTSCGGLLAPACSGSNVASGIYSAVQQLSGAPSNAVKNIVIITDGVPNASSGVDYELADGVYPTATSTTPTCIGVTSARNPTACTDANMQTMAQNQAAVARAAGINISTIYYSGSTDASDQPAYKAFLASLVTGTGIAMVAPTAAQINASSVGFCTQIPSALKMVM